MRILCRVPLVARNWARRKSETIMYIEMSLPPGKRRVIESTVLSPPIYLYRNLLFLIGYEPGLIASIKTSIYPKNLVVPNQP